MKYGLEEEELKKLKDVFAEYKDIESVVLYGSRAKGNFTPFSDVDITLNGDNIDRHTLNQLALGIDDLLLPYQFDISIFSNLKNHELIDHINRRGIIIYQSKP